MKSIAVATLALFAAAPALAQQGVSRDRDRRRHRAGPVRADRIAVQACGERDAHADRRGERRGRGQRPQAAARGRGSRLRSEESGACRAEAGAAGQDLCRARLDRHPDRDGGDADLISTQEVAHLFTAHRRAPDVRAAARPEVLVLRRPITNRSAPPCKRVIKEKNLKKVCAIYQDDDFGQEVLQGGEAGAEGPRHDLCRDDELQARRDRFLLAGAKMKAARLRRVVMGTIIRETIGMIGDGEKARLEPGVHRNDARATSTSSTSSAGDDERFLLRLPHQLPV